MTSATPRPVTAYSDEHAGVYDLIHAARSRDWAAEAEALAALVTARHPEADSLLDVACGTGKHLESFGRRFRHVEGVELSDGMRRIARERLPDTTVHHGDMRTFDLGRTYSAVTCLCFSAAYMANADELGQALTRMARHLEPGGVLVLEPWWFPEKFLDGFVSGAVAQEEGRVVSRLSHSVRDGNATRMTVRYTVADSATGISEFTSYEILSLFDSATYEAAFRGAGLTVEYLQGGPNGRGLFVGVSPRRAS
ncbi:class I SAM-dependent methyltransferase [Streptomyces sp. NPDC001868]|uniref:class I SAM-dependent methyltransferase n=1 Tax=Streptomyces sp. NPDC001868 TaxID=3154401 RepID=UPI0033301602